MNLQSQAATTGWRSDYQIGLDEGRAEQSTRVTELEAQLAAVQKDAERYQWQPIETAPNGATDVFLVAGIGSGRLYWASAAKPGRAPLSNLFYTPTGNSISAPTH